MTATEATSSAVYKNQVQITQYFPTPGKKALYQPTISSFLKRERPGPSGASRTVVILPENTDEPLTPVPDPFLYEGSPPPYKSMHGAVFDTTPALSTESHAVESNLTIDIRETAGRVDITYLPGQTSSTLSRPAGPARPYSNASYSHKPSPTDRPEQPTPNRVWAAVPTIRPAGQFPFKVVGQAKVSPAPSSTLSSFAAGFKAVPTRPPRDTPPLSSHMVDNAEALQMSKRPCERCNRSFSVSLTTGPTSSGDDCLCAACTTAHPALIPTVSQTMASTTSKKHPSSKSVKEIKVYTLQSMSVNGSYGLKSIEDNKETPEDEIRRRNARVYKAEYRARKRELQANSLSPPQMLPHRPDLNAGETRKRQRVDNSGTNCRAHGDADCTEVECVYDFFDEYNPYDDTQDVFTVSRRSLGDTEGQKSSQDSSENITKPCGADNRLIERKLALGLVTGSLDVRRPYLSKLARKFVRNMGNWEGFVEYGECGVWNPKPISS
jgi:hypothetical protein